MNLLVKQKSTEITGKNVFSVWLPLKALNYKCPGRGSLGRPRSR